MNTLQKQSRLALAYFLIIALLGVLLRLFQNIDVAFDYRYIVHTHSHIALLGWVYSGLMVLIYRALDFENTMRKPFNRWFWLTQVTIIGMLVTFPFTGYALFSILFSSLFILASYGFSRLVIKHTPPHIKTTQAYKCIHIGLWYMILSSIGPWALGWIMSTLGSTSDLYRNAIYFYLHFQYNAWFIMALFGIVFYVLNKNNISIPDSIFKPFFRLINIGIVLTFGISILWMAPPQWVNWISGVGSLIQILAIGILYTALTPYKNILKDRFNILRYIGLIYIVKLLLQTIGTIPYIAQIISTNTDFIIGYIHWIFLGIVSPTLLFFLNYFKYIKLPKYTIPLYWIGFIVTEGLIFYKGITLWLNQTIMDSYFLMLTIASIIFLIPIFIIFSFQKTLKS